MILDNGIGSIIQKCDQFIYSTRTSRNYPITPPSVEITVKKYFFTGDDRRARLGISAEELKGTLAITRTRESNFVRTTETPGINLIDIYTQDSIILPFGDHPNCPYHEY